MELSLTEPRMNMATSLLDERIRYGYLAYPRRAGLSDE